MGLREDVERQASRLAEIHQEHSVLTVELADAKANYAGAKAAARLQSRADNPGWTVGEHAAQAELASLSSYRDLVICEERDKALRHEAHSIRQIMSTMQTVGRIEHDLTNAPIRR